MPNPQWIADLLPPALSGASGASASAAEAGAVLRTVSIEGNTVFSGSAVRSLYEGFLGRPLDANAAAQIVARITAKYREAGFFLSHAIAPPQSLAEGMLRVRVIEGYVDKVVIEGAVRDRDLRPYAAAVSNERPLRLSTLERALTIIKDLPGVTAIPSLAPIDEGTGRYELVLKADASRVTGYLGIDNRGPRYIGPWEAQASASVTSTLVPFDQFTASLFTVPNLPREFIADEIAYDVPLGSRGLRAAFGVTHSSFHPGGYLASADLSGSTMIYGTGLKYPMLRDRTRSLWLGSSFTLTDSHEKEPAARLFDDHLRVLRADATYTVTDPWGGNTQIFTQLSEGLPGLGASRLASASPSTPNGHAAFTKIAASLTHERPIVGDFSAFFDFGAQKAFQPLLLSEQFSLGGARFGRGYDPSEALGDNAVAGAVELRYGRALSNPMVNSFQLYAFYDLGEVWNMDPANPMRQASLSSAGAGVRLGLTHGFYFSLEVAKPLTRPLLHEGDKPFRVFGRLSKMF